MAREWVLGANTLDAVVAAISGATPSNRRTLAATAVRSLFGSAWKLIVYQGGSAVLTAVYSIPLLITTAGNLKINGSPDSIVTSTAVIASGNLTAEIQEIPTSSSGRDGGLQPFSSTSVWNLPFGSGVTWGDASDPATAQIRAMEGGLDYAENNYTMSAWEAASTDPLNSVYVSHGDPLYAGTVQIRIPAAAVPSPGTDMHFSIISPDKTTIHEFGGAQLVGANSYTAGTYVPAPISGSGVDYMEGYELGYPTYFKIPGMLGWGACRAYGGSSTGGTVRRGELAGGIQHMLSGAGNINRLTSPWVWPATRDDYPTSYPNNGTASAQVKLGMIFGIKPSVDLSSLGLNTAEYNVCRAMQTHGLMIVDRGGANWSIYHNYADRAEASTINAANIAAVMSAYLCRATNITASTPKGGGTPMYSTVPDIGSGPTGGSGVPAYTITTSSVGAVGSGSAVEISADLDGTSSVTIAGQMNWPANF